MDNYIMAVIAIIVLNVLIISAFIVKHLIKKDEKDKEYNKRVILFNRRTREIKEIFDIDYIESKSWDRVATIYESMIEEFIIYLKIRGFVNNESKYIGTAAKGLNVLRWKFKRFIDEISKIKN